MQEALSKTGLLAVVDDLESRKKVSLLITLYHLFWNQNMNFQEEQNSLLDYEQAVTQTISRGAGTRVTFLLLKNFNFLLSC